MLKRWDHILMVIALVVIAGIVLANQIFDLSLATISRLGARTYLSLGDKPLPIPVLSVEQIGFSDEKSLNQNQIRSAIASAVSGRGITPRYSLKEYTLRWYVTVEDGTLAPVQAQVFVPVGQFNEQFPVIVYGAGSTGLADRCAPSREDLRRGNMGNYRNYMISEASQGYIVVMPNYEGFDNPNRNQHYFNKDNEARTMLSAAQAVLSGASQVSLPVKSGALFFGGYSQGGHAAFAAADYAQTYAPDLKIAGVFGHGPTTEIVEFLKNNPNLAAYFVASYSEYYPAIQPDTILEPTWVGYLDRARTICVNEGFGINSTTVAATYADPFETALLNNSIATDFPAMYQVFSENNAGTSYHNIPTMIVQGLADPIVTTDAQQAFVDQLCQRGVQVDLKTYPGVHHFDTRQVSFRDTNAWIDAVSQGQSVNNTCLNN